MERLCDCFKDSCDRLRLRVAEKGVTGRSMGCGSNARAAISWPLHAARCRAVLPLCSVQGAMCLKPHH
eukprot:10707559-Prorocentrum_lima.AAC.1